jgi:adenylate kinase
MFPNLVLLGAPGSGKGTQSAKLKDIGYSHISTGDLLRSEISQGSELGKKVKSVLDAGELVGDDLVFALLKKNVDISKKSYIFDGFPRTLNQAKMLNDQILSTKNYNVIYFKIDVEQLVKRLTNRRVSEDGKHIYNLLSNPPKKPGICDITGQKLVQRDDDKEDVIRKRMSVFESTISPILDYYRAQKKLTELSADRDLELIFEDIKKIIK